MEAEEEHYQDEDQDNQVKIMGFFKNIEEKQYQLEEGEVFHSPKTPTYKSKPLTSVQLGSLIEETQTQTKNSAGGRLKGNKKEVGRFTSKENNLIFKGGTKQGQKDKMKHLKWLGAKN